MQTRMRVDAPHDFCIRKAREEIDQCVDVEDGLAPPMDMDGVDLHEISGLFGRGPGKGAMPALPRIPFPDEPFPFECPPHR